MKKINLTVVQVLVWMLIFLLWLVYNVQGRPDYRVGLASTVINIFIYISSIYVNSLLLMPRFLQKRQFGRYIFFSALTLLILVATKTITEYFVHYQYFGIHHFYDFRLAHITMAFLSVFLCFIIGGLLHVSLDYLQLLKKQEQLKNQHLSAALNLLKSQVQPHFLFNTLNNIYSLAYIRSEKTAEMVAKLSDMMRYFVEHAPKELVPLSVEIEFLQNYISLEFIRILHPVQFDFKVQVQQEDLMVPPMLFIPFLENVFKHGIDKKSRENILKICLLQNQNNLHFNIINKVFTTESNGNNKGTGLNNIRKRLDILYSDQYDLKTSTDGKMYFVQFTFPISIDYALPTH